MASGLRQGALLVWAIQTSVPHTLKAPWPSGRPRATPLAQPQPHSPAHHSMCPGPWPGRVSGPPIGMRWHRSGHREGGRPAWRTLALRRRGGGEGLWRDGARGAQGVGSGIASAVLRALAGGKRCRAVPCRAVSDMHSGFGEWIIDAELAEVRWHTF